MSYAGHETTLFAKGDIVITSSEDKDTTNLPAVVATEEVSEPEVSDEKETVDYDPTNPTHVSLRRLYDILTYRRPRGGTTEAIFLKRFIDTVPGMMKDLCGNRYVCIGDQNPTVMWSCHTDTVHHDEGIQSIRLKGEFLELVDKMDSNCLGADDGAGIWLMLEMIDQNVPGLYIFHYGEESGCIGSKWIVKNTPELVQGIKVAIAFDRAGYTDVITRQSTGRCCSDAFAKSLALQLPSGYAPDDTGVYTDTAHYIGLIPECTNLSVGYFSQHTASESVNVYHIMALREALCEIDTTTLTIERDPSVVDSFSEWESYFDSRYGNDYGYGSYKTGMSHRGYGSSGSRGRIASTAYGEMGMMGELDEDNDAAWKSKLHGDEFGDDSDSHPTRSLAGHTFKPRTIVQLIEAYPYEVADILEQYGFTMESLAEEIDTYQT